MPRRKTRPISPLEFYGLAGIAMVIIISFLIYRRYSWDPLESWLITVNIVTAFFFAYDKMLAWSGRLRIPEKVLLALALIGGSPGALASMLLLWHKIRKTDFQRIFWAIVVLQTFIGIIWFLMIR